METINISKRNAALTAGISIFIMAILAGFSFGFVLETLFSDENISGLFDKVKEQEALFRMGIFGWLLILIADILAAWGLYVFLKPVNESTSLLTAWMRVFYAAILGVAISQQVSALHLLQYGEALDIWTSGQLDAQMDLMINGFEQIFSMGLIIFGLHLFGLGYLILRSDFIPKIWGWFILLAALGYLMIHTGELVMVDFASIKETLELVFMAPMIVGELGLGIWLMIKGGKS